MPTPEESKPRFNSTLALCLAIIGAASVTYYHQKIFIPKSEEMMSRRGLGNGYAFGNDFYQVWLTSRALISERNDPYSAEMRRKIQIGLYGRVLDPNRASDFVDQRAFPYPVFTDVLFWPLSVLSFSTARIVVFCIFVVLTIASIPLWLQAMNWRLEWKEQACILLLALSSYPALEGLFAGQLGLLVAFLASATLVALSRAKYLLAGTLLALTMIKPQVCLLPIFYLLLWCCHDWAKRKAFVTGLAGTSAALLVASSATLPTWIPSWGRTVLAYRHYTTPPLIEDVITSLLPRAIEQPATILFTIVALAFSVLLAWRNRSADPGSRRFWLTLSILLSVAAVVLFPGQAVYDHLILAPAVFTIWIERERLQRGGLIPQLLLAMGTVVILWPYLAAFGLVLALRLVASIGFHSPAMLALPIRTAASVPFVLLASLVWISRITPHEQKAIS